jgi:hypothetical protein
MALLAGCSPSNSHPPLVKPAGELAHDPGIAEELRAESRAQCITEALSDDECALAMRETEALLGALYRTRGLEPPAAPARP